MTLPVEKRLIRFANIVLDSLSVKGDWDPDILEEIASSATGLGLARCGGDFQRIHQNDLTLSVNGETVADYRLTPGNSGPVEDGSWDINCDDALTHDMASKIANYPDEYIMGKVRAYVMKSDNTWDQVVFEAYGSETAVVTEARIRDTVHNADPNVFQITFDWDAPV
jgi:hypothetical protein